MKYYWLTHNGLNINETGIYPQSIECLNINDIQEYGFGFYSEIIKHFQLPEPILRKSAKKTTYLTITAINEAVFLVIEKKFLQFIKQFKVSEFQTWDLNVQYSDEILKDYCLFHLSSPSQERIIDFSKSDFEIIKYKTKETETRKYLSYEDYKDDWNREIYKGNTLIFNKLFLNFSSINFDIVRLILMPVKGNGYFVSERFKQAIEEQGFTGMAFKEIEQIDSRIKVIY